MRQWQELKPKTPVKIVPPHSPLPPKTPTHDRLSSFSPSTKSVKRTFGLGIDCAFTTPRSRQTSRFVFLVCLEAILQMFFAIDVFEDILRLSSVFSKAVKCQLNFKTCALSIVVSCLGIRCRFSENAGAKVLQFDVRKQFPFYLSLDYFPQLHFVPVLQQQCHLYQTNIGLQPIYGLCFTDAFHL